VKVGDVYLGYSPQADKAKRFVILAISMDGTVTYALLINSRLNDYQLNTPSVRSLKMFLEAAGRPYLDHDSYLDCEEVIAESSRSLKAIASRLKKMGTMSTDDLNKAKTIIKNSGIYSAYDLADMDILVDDTEE
jgi:hypothetical protein